MKALKLILLIPLFFLMACSAAYDQVKEMDIKNPNTFQQHLLNNYKINASFEAEKMHDWNSAKLYSEKALKALSGEKIYPEEVEEAIKLNENVYDCLVVGIQDDRFGQKVIAVVSLEPNKKIETEPLIQETRKHLSGYKLPKDIKFVKSVKRAPNGKADYKWASKVANGITNE